VHTININNIPISNRSPLVLIAGPCQIESREHAIFMAGSIKDIADKLGIGFIYKSSFDKANRTSINGKRGVGIENALTIFAEIKQVFGCSIITDVHTEEQCSILAEVVDILQIPALLSRQTDLLTAAGRTGKVINIKKGQFMAPWDVKHAVAKVQSAGNNKIILTERGSSFGYNTLVTDMRSLKIMGEQTGCPVVFDATHAVQQPSGQDSSSGGERRFVEPLARAAVATGIAGIFMETHQDPDNAPSDGPCMVRLDQLESLLTKLMKIDSIVKEWS
jgi:2-dehydro-3-deoxyphosphooctonate aldolase (KDO 8-P synthase)